MDSTLISLVSVVIGVGLVVYLFRPSKTTHGPSPTPQARINPPQLNVACSSTSPIGEDADCKLSPQPETHEHNTCQNKWMIPFISTRLYKVVD